MLLEPANPPSRPFALVGPTIEMGRRGSEQSMKDGKDKFVLYCFDIIVALDIIRCHVMSLFSLVEPHKERKENK